MQAYIHDLKRLLDELDTAAVELLADALLAVWRDGKKVLCLANGGSSSTVSHIVNDLQKNVALSSGRPLRALCLTDNTPVLMAWANDTQWDNVFRPQVECWADPGDLVIAVSGSGNSENVLNGVRAARASGVRTFGMAGYGGGKLKEAADACLVVHSNNMQRVEDIHMIALHIAFTEVLERTASQTGATR